MNYSNKIVGHDEVDPKTLTPNPANYREHPKQQREAIKGSLSELGWIQEIIVNKTTGNIIDGHLRVEDAIENGESTVPIVIVELTEEEEKLALLVIDPIAAMAKENKDKVKSIIDNVSTTNEAMGNVIDDIIRRNRLKFGSDEIDDEEELEDPDVIKKDSDEFFGELIEKYEVEDGGLWEILDDQISHKILCGDSLYLESYVRLMGGETAEAVVADPPYGVKFKRGQYITDSKRGYGKFGDDIKNDNLSGRSQEEFIESVFSVARKHCAKSAAVYMFCAMIKEGIFSLFGLQNSGVKVQSQLIWNKNNHLLGQADYQWKHETLYYGWYDDSEKHRWYGGRNKFTVIDAKRVQKTIHPNEKPVELIMQYVYNSTQRGDIVLDMFGGSGTTLLACHHTRRRARIIELDTRYVALALNRCDNIGLELKRIY